MDVHALGNQWSIRLHLDPLSQTSLTYFPPSIMQLPNNLPSCLPLVNAMTVAYGTFFGIQVMAHTTPENVTKDMFSMTKTLTTSSV